MLPQPAHWWGSGAEGADAAAVLGVEPPGWVSAAEMAAASVMEDVSVAGSGPASADEDDTDVSEDAADEEGGGLGGVAEVGPAPIGGRCGLGEPMARGRSVEGEAPRGPVLGERPGGVGAGMLGRGCAPGAPSGGATPGAQKGGRAERVDTVTHPAAEGTGVRSASGAVERMSQAVGAPERRAGVEKDPTGVLREIPGLGMVSAGSLVPIQWCMAPPKGREEGDCRGEARGRVGDLGEAGEEVSVWGAG